MKEETSSVEVLTASLSLEFTMGPCKIHFRRGEEDLRFYWPLAYYSMVAHSGQPPSAGFLSSKSKTLS